jgi:hypothetical protein
MAGSRPLQRVQPTASRFWGCRSPLRRSQGVRGKTSSPTALARCSVRNHSARSTQKLLPYITHRMTGGPPFYTAQLSA